MKSEFSSESARRTHASDTSNAPKHSTETRPPKSGGSGASSLLNRRHLLQALAGLGIGSSVFHRAVAQQASEQSRVTAEMIRQAEWIAGFELTDEQREAVAAAVEREQGKFRLLRSLPLDYSTAPALTYHPGNVEDPLADRHRGEVRPIETAPPALPESDDELAFLPVTELASLLRTRKISSVELTRLYLDRLERYDPSLHCVVTLTADLALRQARQADEEIGAGRYRGPLHGVPWGAKDLIAYPGYKTTWGATPFQDQRLEQRATVAGRLDQAGAVLVAKLSLGALAWGDQWFGGRTRNPWNIEQGSSGSSAGSASATAAGLVGFAIGSETLGSIVSPCKRCGVTGLRPTFGRVSRFGCMPLAWSMDKLGPIARSVEDCSLIFGAIHGYDGLDPTARTRPFTWPRPRGTARLRLGVVEAERKQLAAPLEILEQQGLEILPIELPADPPAWSLTTILDTEAAAVFDELTRNNVTEGLNRWPDVFRKAEFIPAIEYLRANRHRRILLERMEQEVFRQVDVYLGGNDLALTNLTGHPSVVLPSGFRHREGSREPLGLTFTGRLFGETELLTVAHAFQQATSFHLQRPEVPEAP